MLDYQFIHYLIYLYYDLEILLSTILNIRLSQTRAENMSKKVILKTDLIKTLVVNFWSTF